MTQATLCGQPKRQGEGNCTRPAGWGTDHPGVGACKLHGGRTKSGRVAAARQRVDMDARALLSRLGEPEPLVDPVRRLQELAGEADQWLQVCRQQVSDLDGNFTLLDKLDTEQVRAMVRQYTEAIDRLHRIGADLVRLNLEDRARRLDEAQARFVWAAVDRGLRRGLEERPEMYGPVRQAIGRAVRDVMAELEPGAPADTTEVA